MAAYVNPYKWGSTYLMVDPETYSLIHYPTDNINEIALLPTPTSLLPASILQGGPTLRKRASFKGWTNMAGYAALEADWLAQTSRQFDGPDDSITTALIFTLKPIVKVKANDYVRYEAEIVDAG